VVEVIERLELIDENIPIFQNIAGKVHRGNSEKYVLIHVLS
jgi:hypothetical protein